VLAIADGRGEEAAEQALTISEGRDGVDEAAFRRRVAGMVVRYSGAGLVELPVGQAFLDIVQAAGESGVRLPAETSLLGKALFNLDAIGRVLSPTFDPTASIQRNTVSLLRKRMLKNLSPGNLVSGALELREFAGRLPGRINRILDAAASNQLGLKINTGIDANQLMVGFQKVANRITTGLVIAALIVGAAMLMRVETSFRIFGYPGFAILLFLVAAAAGIGLLIHILAGDYSDKPGR
jgi:predicted unusual protein kinase regulating ubiquinone biosynthesis (AarF/ABC1/UbiB family)